jgi:hypothetical protein
MVFAWAYIALKSWVCHLCAVVNAPPPAPCAQGRGLLPAATVLGPVGALHRTNGTQHRTTGTGDGHRGGLPGQAFVLGRDLGTVPP